LLLSYLMVLVASIKHVDAFTALDYPGNYCISFDGINDYITVSSLDCYKALKFTIELWMKPKYPVYNGSSSVYGHEIGSLICVGNGWELDLSYEGGFLLFRSRHEPIILSVHGGRETWETEWYYIAVTYDPELPEENLKFYVNGLLEWTHDPSLEVITYNSSNIKIGQHQTVTAWSFGGFIDEVRYWNVCRSSIEIAETYGRILFGSELNSNNLIGYWRFDEGSGMTSQDYSKQGNAAVFGPFPNTPSWATCSTPIVMEPVSLVIMPSFATMLVFVCLLYKKRLK